MTAKRARVPTVSVIALVSVLAGCGGQPFSETQAQPRTRPTPSATPTGNPRARLLTAVARATASRSARLALDMKLSSAQLNEEFTGSGVIDFARGQSMLRLVQSGGATNAMGALEVRVIGRTAYVGHDGMWTTTPLDARSVSNGVPDPTSYMTYLQQIADDVRVDGHEMLRGDDTTRYVATINFARAAAKANPSAKDSAMIRGVMALFGNLKIPVTVWVDVHGRLRKLDMKMDFSSIAGRLGAGAAADAPALEVTMELYDFGVAVNVPVPTNATGGIAAAQVTAAQDHAAQSDLRNALTAEKVTYTDQMMYTSDPTELKAIESALDWGGKLTVVVGDGAGSSMVVVCLSERSKSGTTFALADVAMGPHAGTFYARKGCPASVDDKSFSAFAKQW